MADNITTLNGVIATNEVGGAHIQIVKLAAGNQGSAERIEGTAQFGIKADVTRVGGSVATSPEKAAAATITTVAIDVAEVVIAAANAARKGLKVFNDTNQMLKIKYGAGADADDFTEPVPPQVTWIMDAPIYTGQVSGYWEDDTGGGKARVTET